MKLAIHGADPIRRKPFPAHNNIGEEEKAAVGRVLESGILSKYLGCWHEDFYGGPEVRALEEEWADWFGTKHAIAVNSCTTGLYCAVGAIGTEPGEEIIVPPFTMTATATAPLIFNGIPVFADIEDDCFCLDPQALEGAITPRTKAIIVVDLFGQPYDVEAINRLAREHGLYVIEDTAQAPGVLYKDRYTGTLGDIGVFSLNYHKHIHCGEGGIVVTDNDDFAERISLIRNHAEAVVQDKGVLNLTNMIGFNFRMTELEAAVARCQLRKLNGLLEKRRENCLYLEKGLSRIPAIDLPCVRKGCTHAYYMHACKFREDIAGVSRDMFINAVRAELPAFELRESEGVRIACGYVRPLYFQPIFQKKIAYGSQGYPFRKKWYGSDVAYTEGTCPIAERMHDKELFIHEFMLPSMAPSDLDDVIAAFEKVWENRAQLLPEFCTKTA